jgi:hypothetical protein
MTSSGGITVSDEKISLDPRVALATDRWLLARGLAARVATVTDRMHDLELRMRSLEVEMRELKTRFGGLEVRFGAFEQRFSIQEERMSRMLAILVRVAERQGLPPSC